MKLCLKFTTRILSTMAVICVIVVGMFFADSGRKILLDVASKYFQSKDIVFIVNGLNKKVTKIDEIFIRSPDGIELIFSDVSLTRKNIFDRSSIYVKKFVLNGAEEKIDLNQKIKELIPLMRTLRIFISELSLGKGHLHIAGKTYLLDDLKYRSEEKDDFLYSKINGVQSLNVLFRWDGRTCTESKIDFEKILDFDGSFFVKNPEKETAEYRLSAQNKNYKITSDGGFENFMFDVTIRDALVEYGKKIYGFSGKLCLENQNAQLNAKIDLAQFESAVPPSLFESIKDVRAYCKIDCNFFGESGAAITFKKHEKEVGSLDCVYKDKKIDVFGDISWLKVYGFVFSGVKCSIDNFEKTKINLFGEDFEITSVLKLGEKTTVDSFELKSEKGFLKSERPFFLTKDSRCSFDFNFSRLDFWNKIIPVSGVGIGKFSYENGVISADATFGKLVFDGHKFYSVKIKSDGKNISAESKSSKLLKTKFENMVLKVSENKIDFTGKIGGSFFRAEGETADFFKKVSLKKCEISGDDFKFESKQCELDFVTNSYKIEGQLLSKKNKNLGSLSVLFNPKELMFDFKKFQFYRLAKLFNRVMSRCVLNGNLNLKSTSGIFIGEGKFLFSGLMASRNVLEINTKLAANGMKLSAELQNNSEKLTADTFFPVVLKNNGRTQRIAQSYLLNCRVFCDARLEKLLELSDNSDIRGRLNCDFKIVGSFENPLINGAASWKTANISVGDLLLRNGLISLTADGKNIKISRAEFIDLNGKKLSVTGSGKLFFDGIIPDVKTDLQLMCDNFTLFDSEKMKIVVSGNGAINGPIKDLRLTGKVDVPKCEWHYFSSDNFAKDDDIIIENDLYLDKKQDESEEADFFRYDVTMSCPRVEFSGNLFELKLFGNLTLLTHENKASLAGELQLSDGKLDLFGKRMIFTKGKVVFLPEFPFEPKATFTCQRNFGDISVGMDIKNNPSKGASVNLYSTPNYTQDVILSMMLFGKESKYLSVGEAAQLAHAVGSLRKRGYIFSVLNTFQNTGVIDSISFATENNNSSSLYSDTQNSSGQRNINVSAGKYIHDNVYISVNSKEEGASFDVDFSLTPTISIKANTMGEAGISWKYRY